MDARERTIRYYDTKTGKQPCREWIDGLKDRQARAKIDVRLRRIALGNFGYCESVGHGVMELKIDFGPGYRVYFGQTGSDIIVLLCGGDKSSQARDIKTAHDYWADYRRRYG